MKAASSELNEETQEEQAAVAVADAPSGEGDAVRFALAVPGHDAAFAEIFVRCHVEFDSNSPMWESAAYLNGDRLFYLEGATDRKQAISDAARSVAVSLGRSRRKDDKIAAESVARFLNELERSGDEGLECEACEWPAEQPPAEESAEAPQGEQQQADQSEQPTGEQRRQLADEKNEQFEAEFRTRMARLGEQLVAAVLHRVSCDDRLKSAKAAEKELIEEIQKSAERGPEKMPLFDGKKANAGQPSQGQATSEPTEAVLAADSDAWRSRPISELGLPKKLVERLADNGIETIGRLEDQRASFDGLRGIEGIGEAKADAIEAAVLAWLDKNRDSQVLAEAASEAASDEASGDASQAEQGESTEDELI